MAQFDPSKYVDVQERINRFWTEYPDGAIVTDAPHLLAFEQVVVRASVYKHRDHERPSATGYAAEERGKDYKAGANFTSWHENAETSAIGRALANMGYAVTREDRPSRQEMTRVAAATNGKPAAELVRPTTTSERAPSLYPASREQLNKDLHWEAEQRGLSHDDLHAIVVGQGSKSVADLTVAQLEKFVKWVRSSTPQTIQKAIDAGHDPATLGAK